MKAGVFPITGPVRGCNRGVMPMAESSFDADWKREGDHQIALSGSWNLLLDTRGQRRLARGLAALGSPHAYRWDLQQLDALDSAGALVLWKAWQRRLPDDLVCRDDHRHWFERLDYAELADKPVRHWPNLVIGGIGERVTRTLRSAAGIVLLLGQLMVDLAYCVAHPHEIPWKEISATVHHVGVGSMVLLGAMGFLIGVVMTIQIGVALSQFGAEMMSIRMMGIAVLRELGPMMCGLTVAGRSGSAMAAGIGAMHITGEYDALRAFGVSPSLRLALPRVIGCMLALPLLVVWTDLATLVGSAISAQANLGINYQLFLMELPQQTPLVNFWIGLGKGGLFGLTIALVSCHFGMRASADTASLSRGTTLAVVASLTLILLLDASSGALLINVGLF